MNGTQLGTPAAGPIELDRPRVTVTRATGSETHAVQAGGTPICAVTIRPASPANLAALSDFFAGLSLQSRYLRFFSPITATQPLLRRLSGADDDVDAVIAVRDGVIIGHAMAADRAGTGEAGNLRTTDIGVVVADAWQGRGVGSALIRALISAAQARGVTSMIMDVLHGNRRVLAMILGRWPAADISRYPDCTSVRVRLP